MTAADFRALALQLPGAVAGTHMGHADFRVRGKIFATLGYPTEEFATILLTPQEQAGLLEEGSGAFVPVKGGWGLKGSTNVRLRLAAAEPVRRALCAAHARKSSVPARRSGKSSNARKI